VCHELDFYFNNQKREGERTSVVVRESVLISMQKLFLFTVMIFVFTLDFARSEAFVSIFAHLSFHSLELTDSPVSVPCRCIPFCFCSLLMFLSLAEEIPAGLDGFLRGRPWSSLLLVHCVKICFLPPT
jgi:hypothetical protein